MMFSELSAIILAGGGATRMAGENKAFRTVAGIPVIARTGALLARMFDEVVIVANDPDPYHHLGFRVIPDDIPGMGPLGGLGAGLLHMRREAAFCVACDMPFLEEGPIAMLAERYLKSHPPCLIPRCRGQLHPLHAIYARSVLPALRKAIGGRRKSMLSLIYLVEAEPLDFPESLERTFVNLNTPEEWRDARLDEPLPEVRERPPEA